jgi:4-diphosphocytidyl-2-C-methyl-D-erythritol kinase
LVLEKHLPVASGIGGGSADAAATLRLLARLHGLPAPSPELALALGADVPVCLASTPCIMRGIGEDISPAPKLPAFGLALVNPGIGVATAAIFKARQGAFSPPVTLPEAWPDATTMAADLAAWGNDLQPPAEALCPPITEVLAALRASPGCLLAQMSGSGATCFGIYPTPQAAAAAAEAVRRPGWWSWGGALFSGAAATV